MKKYTHELKNNFLFAIVCVSETRGMISMIIPFELLASNSLRFATRGRKIIEGDTRAGMKNIPGMRNIATIRAAK